jgi:hypothetical protein
MNTSEDLASNLAAIKAINPDSIGMTYLNGIKALPWFTSVRVKLEDRRYWGFFMPLKGCFNNATGEYTCGPNATQNLYHDYEQVCAPGTSRAGSAAAGSHPHTTMVHGSPPLRRTTDATAHGRLRCGSRVWRVRLQPPQRVAARVATV